LNLSIDKIEVKDPEEKIDSNGKSETCRAFERQSRKWPSGRAADGLPDYH